MPTNNVVPIDAEVARAIARRAVKFRWFVAGLAALWLGILIPVLIFTPLPPLVPFVVLGALLVLAEHRFVLFGDETSMSGSIIVAIASVFVFAETAPLAGPMLVASLGGLYLPHIRSRRSCLVISNAAGFSLSALAAAATVLTFGFGDAIAWPIAATCVVVAVSADWVVNSLIVGVATAVRSGDTITTSIRAQLVSDSDVFLLAIAVAALSALYVDRALLIQALYVCTALIAFEMRLKQRRVIEVQSSLTTNRYLNVSLIAVAAMLAWGDPGLGAVALVLFAVFLVQAADRMMLLPAVMAIAIAGVVAGCCSSARMPPIATAACVLAASFVVIEVAAVLARAKRSGRSLNGWVLVGLMMPGPRELAVLGLLAITISTAVPGDLIGVTSPAAIGLIFVMSTALASHLPNRLGRAICP